MEKKNGRNPEEAAGCTQEGSVHKASGFRRFVLYINRSVFGKAIWRIFSGSVTAVLFVFALALIVQFCDKVIIRQYIYPAIDCRYWDETYLSSDVVMQKRYGRYRTSRILDKSTGKVVLKNVDWAFKSSDGDSLAVYSRKGRRGYINRYTAETEIPEIYTRAWVFSEGLAAAEKDGRLIFIDGNGNTVIDRGFKVHPDEPAYAFENGYCIIKDADTGKSGLIDRNGDWALLPEYDYIVNDEGFWRAGKDGMSGLFSAQMDTLFDFSHTSIYIYNGLIQVNYPDHTARIYDMDCNLVEDFHIDEILNMQYETEEIRQNTVTCEDGSCYTEQSTVNAIAKCQRYLVYDYIYGEFYGLMDRNGRPVTPPQYSSIQAIGPDLYLCQPHGVVLNGNGEAVSEKP